MEGTMLRFMLVWVALSAAGSAVAKQNLVLIEFQTDCYDSLLASIPLLEEKGLTVRHIFVPNWLIADCHGQLSKDISIRGGRNLRARE